MRVMKDGEPGKVSVLLLSPARKISRLRHLAEEPEAERSGFSWLAKNARA